MEQSVTVPLERAVSSRNDISSVQSRTREGVSQIFVYFNWGTNTYVGLVRLRNPLPLAGDSLGESKS